MNRGIEGRRVFDDDTDRKRFLLLRCRYHSGLTLRELGAKIGGMDYSAVSDGVRRIERPLQGDLLGRREFEKLKKKLIERYS